MCHVDIIFKEYLFKYYEWTVSVLFWWYFYTERPFIRFMMLNKIQMWISCLGVNSEYQPVTRIIHSLHPKMQQKNIYNWTWINSTCRLLLTKYSKETLLVGGWCWFVIINVLHVLIVIISARDQRSSCSQQSATHLQLSNDTSLLSLLSWYFI